jgi:hypothetical protein
MIKILSLPFLMMITFFAIDSTGANIQQQRRGLRLGQAQSFLRMSSYVEAWEQEASSFFAPLIALQNSYADLANEFSRIDVVKFLNGRSPMEQVSADDMRFLWPLLMEENSPLIKNLSPAQAFAIRKFDDKGFRKFSISGFNKETSQATRLFLLLLEKNESELSKLLEQQNVIEDLIANNDVISELAKVIPQTSSNYQILINIQNLIPPHRSNKVGNEKSFSYPYDDITVISNGYYLSCDAATIYDASERIRELMDETRDENIELSSRAESFFPVLSKLCNGKAIKIKNKNILYLLNAAKYLGMAQLVHDCDDFIVKNDCLQKLVIEWLEEDNEIYDPSSLSMQWNFCDKFRLVHCKKIFEPSLLKIINSLSIGDDKIMREIACINAKDRNEILRPFDNELFKAKLQDINFFSWAWRACQTIRVLRKAIRDFCRNDENRDYLNTITPLLPADISFEVLIFRKYKHKQTTTNQ